MQVDAVVVGAGPAGAVTALLLASRGCLVAMLERRRHCEWRIGETLSPEAKPVLRRLGLEREFDAQPHVPAYGIRSAWGSAALIDQDFIFNLHGPGWQLDRRAFDQMLCDRSAAAGVHLLRGNTVVTMRRERGAWNLQTLDGPLAANWVVDASGRHSRMARRLAVAHCSLDRLVAVYCVLRVPRSRAPDARTVVESCADGWWYAAATPGDRLTIAFHTDADLLRGQPWRSPEWLSAKLRETSHIRTLAPIPNSEFDRLPALVSATSTRLLRSHGEGWLAVGDASMAFDPLSGSGLLKALLSGERAAAAIMASDSAALEHFAAWNEARWREFVTARADHYEAETRWGDAPFWARRRHDRVQYDLG